MRRVRLDFANEASRRGTPRRGRHEERCVTDIPVKLIRSNGASFSAAIADFSEHGLRIEGVEGLTVGEHALVILPHHRVLEIVVRWALGDQIGARLIN